MSDRRGRLRAAAGMALLVAGLLGMLLPVLPGLPMLVAGIAILGPDHPWARALAGRLGRWRARARKERT